MRRGWAPALAGLALVAGGCGSTTTTTSTDPVANSRRVTWENVTFVLPETWAYESGPGAFAAGPRVHEHHGYPMGHVNAVSGFDGSIDDLAPRLCQGGQKPAAVGVVESGPAPVGDRTAQFQRWAVTCSSGVEYHRAWVLPISRIALYEVCQDEFTVAVASSATVAARPQGGGRGVRATQAGRGVQATQAGRGVQATQAGRGVQATQAGPRARAPYPNELPASC